MDNLPLLDVIGAKIKYLSTSQEIVAQNIANADTPGYRPQTLAPVDFAALLNKSGTLGQVSLQKTNPRHLGADGTIGAESKSQNQRMTYEVAPAGNAVILEEQLVNAAKIRMDYDLAVNLYTKNMGLLRTALGTGR